MITRHTNLPSHVISFCRYLRQNDFTVGTNEQTNALNILGQHQAFSSPLQFKQCLQAIMCKSQKDLQLFSNLFDTYWKELATAVDGKINDKVRKQRKAKQKKAGNISQLKNWLFRTDTTESFETALYSADAITGQQSPMNVDEDELAEILKTVERLVKRIANRRTRRYVSSKQKNKIDIRKSIRRNILSNGDLLNLLHKSKKKNLRVVILCDVSRSMDLYSRFFIQFLYAFKSLMEQAEIFVFGTSLHRITDQIDEKDLEKSLHTIFKQVTDWSGGTKIGKSLQCFVDDYGHRYLSGRTLCFIISDGWDTGNISQISESMEQIHKRSMKTIWLNPLMENANWKPEVSAMKAAMPFIDLLLPFYNLESMKDLAKAL